MVTFLNTFAYFIYMTAAITKSQFSVYCMFFAKFEKQAFDLSGIKWYFSRPMLKKIIFRLVSAGWLERLSKGRYKCIAPEKAEHKERLY